MEGPRVVFQQGLSYLYDQIVPGVNYRQWYANNRAASNIYDPTSLSIPHIIQYKSSRTALQYTDYTVKVKNRLRQTLG